MFNALREILVIKKNDGVKIDGIDRVWRKHLGELLGEKDVCKYWVVR